MSGEHDAAPPAGALHVVGAAIVEDGRCLITRRGPNMSAPLKWEFPGGKVEPGETPRAALRREVREELDIDVEIGPRLGHGVGRVEDRTIYLEVYAARRRAGTLRLAEHHDHGWFGPDDLAGLDWPEADAPILPAVAEWLRGA